MKAVELRIGNWVNLEDKGVYQISSGHDIEEAEDWDGEKYITGVPISEDWLLKFGFNQRYSSQISKIYEHQDNDSITLRFKLFNDTLNFRWDGFFVKKLEYVHQLQNLYQALTGEELEIKK